MLWIPIRAASDGVMSSGTCPANRRPRARDSAAIARNLARSNPPWTLMKSEPAAARSSTVFRASSGVRTIREEATGRPSASNFGPAATMRGPTRRPASIALRHRLISSKSLPISRTPVTPFAINKGSDASVASDKCTCMSQRPAIRNRPAPSTIRASDGTGAFVESMLTMRPSRTMTVALGRSALVAVSTMETFEMAMLDDGPDGCGSVLATDDPASVAAKRMTAPPHLGGERILSARLTKRRVSEIGAGLVSLYSLQCESGVECWVRLPSGGW